MNHRTLNTVAEKVAAALLETQAVQLQPEQPFTWASGWKSPIYCDNRLTLSFPTVRGMIADALAAQVDASFSMVEAIAGVATAGIPWATLVAERLGLPLLYIRSAAKDHGKQNLIEGKIVEEQRVVVIEDLISTGGSSIKAAQAVNDAEMEAIGMVAVFTYGFPLSVENFERAQIPLHTLSNYSTLIDMAARNHYVTAEQVATLQAWREAPESWGV